VGKGIKDFSLPSFGSYLVNDNPSGREENEEPNPSTSRVDLHTEQDLTNGVNNVTINCTKLTEHLNDYRILCDKYKTEGRRQCLVEADKIDKIVPKVAEKILLIDEMFDLYGPILTSLEPVDIDELEEENIEEEQEEVTMPQEKINKLIGEVKTPKQDERFKLDESDKDDIIIDRTVSVVVPSNLPLVGPLEYPVVKRGQTVYAMKFTLIDPWYRGNIKYVVKNKNMDYVKILFQTERKSVQRKQIAYTTMNSVIFPLGCRVIAKLTDPNSQHDDEFFAGIVAEAPQTDNKFR